MKTYEVFMNNQIQGPYSVAEIESMILDKSIDCNSKISDDNGRWVLITDFFPSLFLQHDISLVEADRLDKYNKNRFENSISSSTKITQHDGIGRVTFAGVSILIGIFGLILSSISVIDTHIVCLAMGATIMLPAVSRLKDIGKNPAWCFLFLVPGVCIVVWIPCLLLPTGYQRHRQLDLPAKIIIGIFVAILMYGYLSLKRLVYSLHQVMF